MPIQTILAIVFFVIYGVVAVINSWANGADNTRIMRITKPLLMPLLFVAYLFMRRDGVPFYPIFAIALVCGWIGDITLDKPEIGVTFFLLEHVLLSILFIKSIPETPALPYLLITIFVLLGIGCLFLWKIKSMAGKYFPLITIYGIVILVMTGSALLLLTSGVTANRYAIAVGSILFVVSDIILSEQVIESWFNIEPAMAPPQYKQPNYTSAIVMATYTAAQLLFTLGIGQML